MGKALGMKKMRCDRARPEEAAAGRLGQNPKEFGVLGVQIGLSASGQRQTSASIGAITTWRRGSVPTERV